MKTIIYQVSGEKISKTNYIQEGNIQSLYGRRCQNCRPCQEEERLHLLNRLVFQVLPHGMFSVMDAHTIRYNGGMEAWNRMYYHTICEKTREAADYDFSYLFDTVADLEEYIVNPLGEGTAFRMEESRCNVEPDSQMDFLWWVNTMFDDTLIHIGVILECE